MGELNTGLDQGRIIAALHAEVHKQVEVMAEPIIKAALVEIEKGMREQVNSVALKIMEKHYSFERREDNLVITIFDRRG